MGDDKCAIAATTRTLSTLVDGTVRVKVDIEPKDATLAMTLFGQPGTGIAIAVLNDNANHSHLREDLKIESSSWQQALFRSSFFRRPSIWPKVGSDEEFRSWVREQPCIVCKASPVDAAHVRRVEFGAGVGIKPEYSCIPLCREHHRQQHDQGESSIGSDEDFRKWRIFYLHKWCWESVKKQLGFDSWSKMPLEVFKKWAITIDEDCKLFCEHT